MNPVDKLEGIIRELHYLSIKKPLRNRDLARAKALSVRFTYLLNELFILSHFASSNLSLTQGAEVVASTF